MRRIVIGCAVAGLIALVAESESKAQTVVGSTCLPAIAEGRPQTGVAGWYGPEFQGSPTATGELYNSKGSTAAHRTLPLGTTIRVTNLKNRKNVLLRVNDRGPHNNKRMLDVSRAAAETLGFLRSGTAQVRVEVVSFPKSSHAGARNGTPRCSTCSTHANTLRAAGPITADSQLESEVRPIQ